MVQVNGKRKISTPKPQPVPEKIIRERLSEILQETLAPEQWDRYREEAERRVATRRRTAIAGAVARLDAALFLTAEQRGTIAEAISANWQDRWEKWTMIGIYGNQFLPQIPDNCVECLNDEQKSVWQACKSST